MDVEDVEDPQNSIQQICNSRRGPSPASKDK